MLCLTLPKYGFNFVTQKFAKTEQCSFQTLRTFVFEHKEASYEASYDQLSV